METSSVETKTTFKTRVSNAKAKAKAALPWMLTTAGLAVIAGLAGYSKGLEKFDNASVTVVIPDELLSDDAKAYRSGLESDTPETDSEESN